MTNTDEYRTVFCFLIGALVYQIAVSFSVCDFLFDISDDSNNNIDTGLIETLFSKIPLIIGGIFFFLGGYYGFRLNYCLKFRPHRLGWWVAWFNFFGGILFGIGGFGCLWINSNHLFWQKLYYFLTTLPYLIGSLFYLIGSVGTLIMWKLEQFGLAFLPKINIVNQNDRKHTINFKQLFFILLYCVVICIALIGGVYSQFCHKYRDWIKDFLFAMILPFGMLVICSIIHRDPEKKPYAYLLWFVRVMIFWFCFNVSIDAYHVSPLQCGIYGS